MAARLFVSGLPPNLVADDLAQRFSPFGEVVEVRIAPPKTYPGGAVFPRSFAHVELVPKDEAALRKCVAAYNGCKWRGATLKCALARPHFEEARRREAAAAAAAVDGTADEAAVALPPLGPGSTLRLKPPKAAVVEVMLGSGRQLHDFGGGGTSRRQSWEPLDAPAASGYRYEQHLQRLAADLPPELVALAEARRARGRALFEERERQLQGALGVEVFHQYSGSSQDGAGWEVGSDDDAATAAAAAAAALARRERRSMVAATAAGPKVATPSQRQRQDAAQQQQRKEGRGAAQPVSPRGLPQHQRQRVVDFVHGQQPAQTAGADLSRFDSDSDAEWVGPAAAASKQPAGLLLAALPTRRAQEEEPTGSSGSSGGSELEEWLAAGGAALSSGSDPGADELRSAISSGSSGGSELEEFLAAGAGGDADIAGTEQQDAAAATTTRAADRPQHSRRQPDATPPQGVADFLDGDEAALGRRWWQRPVPAGDLSRFASSSDDDEFSPVAAAPAPVDSKRQREEQQHRVGKKRRGVSAIPQVDGAADSDSTGESSEESSSGDDASSSEEQSSSSSEEDGGATVQSGGATAESSSSSEPSSSDADDSSSDADDGSSDEQSGGEELAGEANGVKPEQAQAAAEDSGGTSGSSSGEDEEADGSAAAAAAAVLEQQRRLTAVFPEGAAFKRDEPLAQIEAAWRVNREALARDYHQKHRQATRMLGRQGGGSGKRQRKG